MERDPERVLADVLNGYIDTDIAAEHYGVVIVADQVDDFEGELGEGLGAATYG